MLKFLFVIIAKKVKRVSIKKRKSSEEGLAKGLLVPHDRHTVPAELHLLFHGRRAGSRLPDAR
jgi:hypothetical protein